MTTARPASTAHTHLRIMRVLAGATMLGVAISWPLWIGARAYPVVPLASPPVGASWSGFIFLATLASALVATWGSLRLQQCSALAVLLAYVLCAVSDQSRLQPWVFQYVLLIGALGLRPSDTIPARAAALDCCRLIVVATYTFSGLHKFNATFATTVVPYMLQSASRFGAILQPFSSTLGIALALLETVLGVALCVPRFRAAGRAVAIGMHAAILLMLAAGHSGANVVVWPWNLCMILLVWMLFADKTARGPIGGLRGRSHSVWAGAMHRAVLIACVVLPALSLVGRWDSYLSFAVYSGNTDRGILSYRASFERCLPPLLQVHARRDPVADAVALHELDISTWSMRALAVPSYPEGRIFRAITRDLCRCAIDADSLLLTLRARETWLAPARYTTHDCGELLSLHERYAAR